MGVACALGAAARLAPDGKWARTRHRPCRRGGAAAADRGHALPDVLARGDLGAAARLRALRPARSAARAADRAAGGGHPGGDRGQDRLRQRAARAGRLRHRPRPPPSQGRTSALVVLACAVGRRRAAGGGAAAGSAARGDRDRGGQPALPAPGAVGRARARAAARRARRRRAAADRPTPARRSAEGRYMDYSARPADAADLRGRQRADRQLARRAGRVRRASRCTAPAPARTGSPGTRSPGAADQGQRRALALPRDAVRARASSGSCCCWSRSATLLVVGAARLGGPERHAHGAFLAAGADAAGTPAIDWDWEMPALFVWFFGAGGVALAARDGARSASSGARRGSSPRWRVLVLALTPALFALLAGAAGPRAERVRARATATWRSTRR